MPSASVAARATTQRQAIGFLRHHFAHVDAAFKSHAANPRNMETRLL